MGSEDETRRDEESVVWTPNMPERRLSDRRNGVDRRNVNGRAVAVPDLRAQDDRRANDRRVRLTITGRALDECLPPRR